MYKLVLLSLFVAFTGCSKSKSKLTPGEAELIAYEKAYVNNDVPQFMRSRLMIEKMCNEDSSFFDGSACHFIMENLCNYKPDSMTKNCGGNLDDTTMKAQLASFISTDENQNKMLLKQLLQNMESAYENDQMLDLFIVVESMTLVCEEDSNLHSPSFCEYAMRSIFNEPCAYKPFTEHQKCGGDKTEEELVNTIFKKAIQQGFSEADLNVFDL
ncbi:MAG: hypothetical protein CL677_09550 [Bdellovibrionaceae bacterium]|nr:hypothetical protein [Pseudobdellovibrionaceae bacterium]|tara:strand:+ start:360 stop:998 length:639 start_codon:yes stop_codon:yes gene_type:complete